MRNLQAFQELKTYAKTTRRKGVLFAIICIHLCLCRQFVWQTRLSDYANCDVVSFIFFCSVLFCCHTEPICLSHVFHFLLSVLV